MSISISGGLPNVQTIKPADTTLSPTNAQAVQLQQFLIAKDLLKSGNLSTDKMMVLTQNSQHMESGIKELYGKFTITSQMTDPRPKLSDSVENLLKEYNMPNSDFTETFQSLDILNKRFKSELAALKEQTTSTIGNLNSRLDTISNISNTIA